MLLNSQYITLQIDKLPHVCGGWYRGCDKEDFTCTGVGENDECYQYNPGRDSQSCYQFTRIALYCTSLINSQDSIHGTSQES